MSESTKAVNYTQEMVDVIVSEYEMEPTRETVEALGRRFEKSPRSIIAKLSSEGVYVKQERIGKTKTGADVVRKAELVAQVESRIGRELPSLVKMNKVDLQFLITELS
jgi:hypothetical protein